MTHKRRAKAPKNTTQNTSKVPQEVDLTTKSTLPVLIYPTAVEQSKGPQTFFLNMAVYTNSIKLFSNVLPTLFGAFNFQEFITENAH